MSRKYKVIQCPNCSKSVCLPLSGPRNSCLLCGFTIVLNEIEGPIINEHQADHYQVQEQQLASQYTRKLNTNLGIAEHVLQILKSYKSDNSKWLPLHEVFRLCLESGLTPKEIRKALDVLNAGGFLEKREDTVRMIPLN